MILALALSSWLSAVPHSSILDAPRAARLVVDPSDVPDAQVELLTLAQLHAERHRLLTEAPGIVGPITLLSLGGAGIFVFGGFTWFLIDQAVRPFNRGLNAILLGLAAFVTGVVTIVALAGAIVGMVLLMRANNRRDAYARRGDDITARIGDIEAGRAVAPLPPSGLPATPQELALDRDIRLLETSRPGIGLPIGLMAGGGGAAIYAISPFLTGSSGIASSAVPIYVVAGIAAASLLATGSILLVVRLQDRARIDAELAALRSGGQRSPPPLDEVAPPPAPLPPPPLELNPGGQPTPPPPPPSSWAPPASPILISWGMSF